VRPWSGPNRCDNSSLIFEMPELWEKSAAEISDGYKRGEYSPVEVFDAIFKRCERINPLVNAIVTLDLEGARNAARDSESRWRSGGALGPLDGVPITIKDNIPVRGMAATWGSKLYADFIPTSDELPIARLRAGGAIILGKTNCPEFTLQGYTDNLLFGPTRNPWNLELTPGGSSGGAVAAVSAGLGPIAVGTDGGGSIRRPASHTGLVGLKPSRGRVPRCDGFPAILLDFETVGPIARTVTDVILAMETISDYDPRDPLSAAFADRRFEVPAPLSRRILYVPRFGASPVDPEIANSVQSAARVLAELGHDVEEGRAPFDIDAVAQAWPVFSQVGLAWLIGGRTDWRGKVTKAIEEMATSGLAIPSASYYSALNAVQTLRCALSVFFTRYDVIMTPAAAALPWPAAEAFPPVIADEKVGPRGHAVFTAFANMAGCPGINLPAVHSSSGLPIGFQLVAAPGKDGLLCSIAMEYESLFRWSDRWPSSILASTHPDSAA
jgi:aspartyl-tRNA(Asn)/glutamyl-tRNA(Gln) amidotransferase subunit A